MYSKTSRINLASAQGSLVYLTGGKNLKDQKIAILTSNELYLPPRDVSVLNADYEITDKEAVGKAKMAARHLSNIVAEQFRDVQESASSRVKNSAPCHGYISFANGDLERLKEIVRRRNEEEDKTAKEEHRKAKPTSENAILKEIADKYMEKMGLKDTLYLVTRHYDTNLLHIHFAFSWVQPDGRVVPLHLWTQTSNRVCNEIEKEYGFVNIHNRQELREKAEEEARRQGMSEEEIKEVGRTIPRYHDANYRRDKKKSNPNYNELELSKGVLLHLLNKSDSPETFFTKARQAGYIVRRSEHHSRVGVVITLPSGRVVGAGTIDRRLTYGNLIKFFRNKKHNSHEEKQNLGAKDRKTAERILIEAYNSHHMKSVAKKASFSEKGYASYAVQFKNGNKTAFVVIDLHDGHSILCNNKKELVKPLKNEIWAPHTLARLVSIFPAIMSGVNATSAGTPSHGSQMPLTGDDVGVKTHVMTDEELVEMLVESGLDPAVAEKIVYRM